VTTSHNTKITTALRQRSPEESSDESSEDSSDNDDLRVFFDGDVGKPVYVHGNRKFFKTEHNVVLRSTTMHTTDGKYKC
jgi:hypothetical protein